MALAVPLSGDWGDDYVYNPSSTWHYEGCCSQAINAGVDLAMEPDQSGSFIMAHGFGERGFL
jgi:hypothetical protein